MQRNVSCAIITITAITAVTLLARYLYKKKKKTQPPKIWKEVGVVTKLHLYPLKSGRRVELKKAECFEFGIKQHEDDQKVLQLRDRCFAVYGENTFDVKTARTFPKMVLIEVTVHDDSHVAFDAPGMRSLYVKIPTAGKNQQVTVILHGKEEIFSLDCGPEAASWLSRYIKDESTGLRLGYHDGSRNHDRDLKKFYKDYFNTYEHLRSESMGVYSDLTAILLLNQSSVDELNTRLENKSVTVEHFRPTITMAGNSALPYSEDDWDWVKIGEAIFRNVKPCTRCIFTTVDPEAGVLDKDMEPLKTLRKYRLLKDPKQFALDPKSPVMGINLGINKKGVIQLNDVVYVG